MRKDLRFLIVGLGLIGGSFAKVFKANGFEVGAIDLNEESIDYAIKKGLIDEGMTYADKNFIYASPVDFVNLVRHASCVISNSFHGTCFAMIFNVPYVIVDRPDGLNERMRDLLQRRQLPCQEHHSGEGESPRIE